MLEAVDRRRGSQLGPWPMQYACSNLRTINQSATSLLAATPADNDKSLAPFTTFGLPEPISFDDLYFDSTRLKVASPRRRGLPGG